MRFVFFGLFLIGILGFFPTVFAAEFFFTGENDIRTGDILELKAVVNSAEAVNALEGRVIYPVNNLTLQEVRYTNSFLNLWLEEPYESEPGNIIFSGIVPGGWQGRAGEVFTLIFQVKSEGLFYLAADNVRLLKHDGLGTSVEITLRPLMVSVFKRVDVSTGGGESTTGMADNEPPESFVPEIIQSDLFYSGRAMLAFYTEDKGSGMEYFEVKEVPYKFLSWFFPYQTAVSPYELKDQDLTKTILIKAVDKNGNERVVIVQPRQPRMWYKRVEIWCIISILLVGLFFLFKKICFSLVGRR